MGKADMGRARDAATTNTTNVANRVNGDVTGNIPGNFGPGLSSQRNNDITNQQDLLGTSTANYKTNAVTGGFDPGAKSTIEGGYTDMANIGGFNPQQSADFMRQATSGVPAIYNTLENQAQRDKSLTGGLGTGGELAQMARQMSQQQSAATTAGEVALNQQQNSNKLAGLGGLTTEQGTVAAGKNAANTGLTHLVDTTTGEISDIGNKILAEYGLQDASQAQKIALLQQFGLQGPSALSRVTSGIGDVAGAITGVGKVATGLGAL